MTRILQIMTKRIVLSMSLAVLLVHAKNTTYAQDLQIDWISEFKGVGNVFLRGVDVGSDGHVYTAGYYENGFDADPGAGTVTIASNSTSDKIFWIRLDENGEFVRAREYGNTSADQRGYAIAVSNDDHVAITGNSTGAISFGALSASGAFMTTYSGPDQGGLHNGKLAYISIGASTNSNTQHGFGVDIDDAGNQYFVGRYSRNGIKLNYFTSASASIANTAIGSLSSASENTSFVTKLDADGNLAWAWTNISNKADERLAGVYCDNEYVYITGRVKNSSSDRVISYQLVDATGTVTSKNMPAVEYHGSGTTTDAFIAKIDAQTGALVWVKTVGGSKTDSGFSIVTDADSNVYVTGIYQGTADMNPDPNVDNSISAGNSDYSSFVLKLNADGEYQWAYNIKSSAQQIVGGVIQNAQSQTRNIGVDQSGGVYVSGFFHREVDLDPSSTGGINTTAGNSNRNLFLVKIDDAGNFVWGETFGGQSGHVTSTGMTVDYASGDIFLSGYYNAAGDYSLSGSATTNTLTPSAGYDAFIMKLSQPSLITSTQEIDAVAAIHPNPASDVVYTAKGLVTIFDLSGQGVLTTNSTGAIDISALEAGVYIVNLNGNKQKLIIE